MPRLSKPERRAQLLDTAAELVLERGLGGLTMEGLAARAGVSKAVPYLHFDNSDAVVVALYERETDRMGERITDSMRASEAGAPRVGAALCTYLDVVEERGAVLGVLGGPGSPVLAVAGGERSAVGFTAELLRRSYGLPRREAAARGAALYGALLGLVDAWAHGEVRRSEVERTAMAVADALGRAPAPRRPQPGAGTGMGVGRELR